ncbi:hypothetical protein [Gilvimarinus chinensis]|uniref:hypothetical protein n=1 Tax=Gilvimarinus chinensis TaxID=396005 RepID=UPI00036B16D7|nr:hypothetical protein [Gilvimarinus chinensis]
MQGSAQPPAPNSSQQARKSMPFKSKVAAAVIIALVLLVLGLYLWAGAQRAGLLGYGFMRLQQSELVVNFDRSFVWLNAQGRERKTVELMPERLQPIGEFDFFANGDLLIYHRANPPGVMQNLAAFFRLRQGRQKAGEEAPGERPTGFYRCVLSPLNCQPLAYSSVKPARSMRFVIDRAQNIIYLADTADHSLYKLSAEGEVLASRHEGFQFPNQLVLLNTDLDAGLEPSKEFTKGSLWLADTNHHRLVQLDTQTDTFARELQSHQVTLQGEHRWPHQMTASPEGFWVLVANNAMARGRLALVDPAGKITQPLTKNVLSDAGLTDPLALQYWQGGLWLTDFAEPKLVRIHPQTGRVQTTESASLQALEQEYLAQYGRYKRFEYIALGLFVVIFIGGFAAAWMLEKEQTRAAFRSATKGATFSVDGEITPTGTGDVLWLDSALKPWHHWLPKIIWGIWALMLVAVVVLYLSDSKAPASIMQLGLIMVMFLGVVSWGVQGLFRFLSASKLGVIGESLVLVDGKGARTIAKGNELAYSQHFICADQVAIALGNPNLRFFHEAELKRWVYPRLKHGHKLSAWQQNKHLWRLRHPQMMYSAVMLLAVFILYVLIEFVLVKS